MSSEGENSKNPLSEVTDKTTQPTTESSPASGDKEVKAEKENEKESEKSDADSKSKEKVTEEKSDQDTPGSKKEQKVEEKENVKNDEKKDKKDDKTDEDSEEEEGSDKDEEDSDKDEKKDVPLLDQPLEQSGTRERKKVQRFNDDTKLDVGAGSGLQLGEIPRIDASISRFKNDDLKLLHKLLFKTPGKTTIIKKNIRNFNGFDFKKDSDEYTKKISAAQKFEVKQLKSICEMLDLDKKGSRDEISERIVDFLLDPKDSGKPAGGGRPKRTAAVRANNRGYSSHDDSYSSDERQAARGKRGKGRRTNLKDESSSESDEDFHPSDASEERPRVNRRKRVAGRKRADSEEEPSELEEESLSTEESDEGPKKKKRIPVKVANNKSKGKAVAPKTRGRKPAPAAPAKKKVTPKKGGRKRSRDTSEEEEEEDSEQQDNDVSSSEDEPLVKKAKSPQPPTDEEIKKYVKEILDGANLEEITMKTVCKQVYAHYPDFDLAHKKDFIKSTVKSLIST